MPVASRAVAAILGGYGLATLIAMVCAAVLPTTRAESVLTGMLLGLAAHACAVIWVFAARTARAAWAGLALPAAGLSLILLLWRGRGLG